MNAIVRFNEVSNGGLDIFNCAPMNIIIHNSSFKTSFIPNDSQKKGFWGQVPNLNLDDLQFSLRKL
ncbi:hypothetical protein SAMD00019534_077900 [Acytostelium subglobosum LB1]|uniref:hypothetical protein n=1 Tax=Acytostelium subglobosum LB1 TaxID=1410327 RepID=UPI0006450FC1|nr:hypothetical protein SAMD00019534_077900 [Acytostelium subglobosum LB1]GAM24615.1 hypothetical protein SAMD00019534_077900 [Acytostelium subglobosum LB1]|eukprot:XP_012752284.1 hypothetical protein SAMD00019534_077900 [Acytostelium subglobosum LB1]